MVTFKPYTSNQLLLLPPALQDWFLEGQLALFVSGVVDAGMDLTPILVTRRGMGVASLAVYPPRNAIVGPRFGPIKGARGFGPVGVAPDLGQAQPPNTVPGGIDTPGGMRGMAGGTLPESGHAL